MQPVSASKHRWHLQRGFTLVELLVALVVMALLGLMAWRGLDGMSSARVSLQQRSDAVQTLQSALTQWQADLDAMVPPAQSAVSAPVSATALAAASQVIDWNGAVLRITREDRALAVPALRVVAWTRRSAAEGGDWMRWQSAPIRSAQAWQAAWAEGVRWAQVADTRLQAQAVRVVPLQGWRLYYFRNDSWSNPASSAEQAALVPDGVRLVIDVAPGQALAGRITRDWVRPTLAGNKS